MIICGLRALRAAPHPPSDEQKTPTPLHSKVVLLEGQAEQFRNDNKSHYVVENKADTRFGRGISHYVVENKGPICLICLTFFAFLGESHYVVENTSRQF
jgi:hypothetical protein